MDKNDILRKDIRELKRMVAALKSSYKAILQIVLKPLQKRQAKLEARLARKRR
jgi:hypothetical protein